jgi:hypothetical protein
MFRRRGDLLVELCEFHKAWPQDARYANGWPAEAAAEALPKEQKEQLLTFLAARLGWTLDSIGAGTSSSVRRAGLHAGVWEVAQDFDASLPDEFWLDRNA